MLVSAFRVNSIIMFLPRIQSKVIALLLVIGTLYLITLQWGTPKVPTSLSYPFTKHNPTSTSSSSAASTRIPYSSPAKPPTLEKGESAPDVKPKVSIAAKPPSSAIQAGIKPTKNPTGEATSKVDSDDEDELKPLPKEPGLPHATFTPAKAEPTPPLLNSTSKATTKDGQIAFWKEFATLLGATSPDCPGPNRQKAAEAQPFIYQPTDRYDVLSMPDGDVVKMQRAHEKFLAGLHGKAADMVYTSGTRGLVTTAGGRYLPVFVVSLRMLRRRGTKLPMEVFLADENEYESYICDHVFPELNAKCVVLSDILKAAPHSIEIDHYQYKVFAMIFSSFEEVLFLDSDAFPVYDADYLFTKEPFVNNGLVTWPDYWASSASPIYYKIAGQPVPSLTLRQSTESGELLLNKKTHSKSLLLATYYNYYGPSHYYVLFSQGAAGEGDKETFIAAAYALNETFYQVAEPVRAIGHATSSSWTGSAMVQFDPVQDYGLTQKGLFRNKVKDAAGPIRPFFLHVNVPRLNPAIVFDQKEHTNNAKGEPQRIWQGADAIIGMFNRDIEKEVWEEVKWVSCELEQNFEFFKDEKGLCEKATKHYEGVFGKSGQQPQKSEPALNKPNDTSSKPKGDTPHPFGASSADSG